MTGADLTALFKKHPIACVAGLVCVACGVAMYFRSGALGEAQARFEEKDGEAKKIAANVRSAAGLAEQTEEMKEAGRQFESRLVRAGQLASNLQFFYRLEAETGVKLLDVRQNPIPAPRAGGPRPTYAPVPFGMSVQGTYPQVLAFIRRIESGPHFARFTNVTFTKSTAEKDVTDLMNVSIAVELLGTP